MGGEKHIANFNDETGTGSPPRGRGKVLTAGLYDLVDGITPAWAGKSRTESFGTTSSEDHPRVGGEKQRMPVRTDKRMGSPPRGRGKVSVEVVHNLLVGITPAWAGKRLLSMLGCAAFCGSPPRGRGKVELV